MAAMDSWIQATAKQDVAGLEKILHDELWYSHSAGTHQNKAEVIKDVQEGRDPPHVVRRPEDNEFEGLGVTEERIPASTTWDAYMAGFSRSGEPVIRKS